MTDKFENDLRRVFGAGESHVDARTRQQLAARRRAALDTLDRKPRAGWWLPAGAVAAALLAAVIMRDGTNAVPVTADSEAIDMEILLAEDNLELYEDLDFFEWLSTVEDEAG